MHVRQYAYLAKAVECPIYIQHTTTEETMQEIVRARAEGGRVTSQTGHHYLSLPEDTWRINVPLRNAETIEKLWIGLRDGIIDCVGSDHVNRAKPREQMEKPGNVWGTESGFASRVEALLPVMLSEGVYKGRISLERMVQVCCENTARSFGLFPQKGSISIGADADLVLVDLKKRVRLTRDMIHSRAGWSIYEGWDFNGWPLLTMLRGEVISRWNEAKQKSEIVGSPKGKCLARNL
jgi:dihydropyrimidinase/dihydroorotase